VHLPAAVMEVNVTIFHYILFYNSRIFIVGYIAKTVVNSTEVSQSYP